jgi:hypothetical protein
VYSKTKKGSVAFDGQMVAYELSRLTIAEARTFRDGGAEAVEAAFRKHLLSLGPIRGADGSEVPTEVVLTEFYFSNLVNAVVAVLMETGDIPKAKVSPSGASSPAGSPGDDTR